MFMFIQIHACLFVSMLLPFATSFDSTKEPGSSEGRDVANIKRTVEFKPRCDGIEKDDLYNTS